MMQRAACRLHFIVCCAALVALVTTGCSSDEDAVPAQVDSGFDFRNDAFAFANFAHNDNGFDLTPDLTARLCGRKLACTNDALPCLSTETAAQWTAGVNQTLYEGRSEGFAVLAQLFSMGKLKPSDFGADTSAELVLEHNAKLQAELAYWAATQSVPKALVGDKHFSAKDVMPFLADALSRGDKERYRLAIAMKTETGFERGHALVPIGYYRVNHEGLYILRVYDSNFPASERELTIDVAKDSWRYEVPLDETNTLVYEGTAKNGNQLYFSAVTPRTEKLVCPFDASSGVASAATVGKIQASIGVGDAQRAGFEDGKLVEHGDSRVTPAFANCPTCNPSSGILNFTVPKDTKEDLKVVLSGGVAQGSAKENTGAEVHVSTANTTTSVKGIKGDPSKKDELIVRKDGTLTYDSDTGSQVQLTHTLTSSTGKEQSVSVAIKGEEGSTAAKTTSLSISVDKSGRYSVDTAGFPAGTKIDLTYVSTDAKGNKVTTTTTVTATGSPDHVKFNSETGEIFSEQGTCNNKMFDKGFEVGVDCGDACPARCTVGQSCNTYEDCVNGAPDTSPAGQVFCTGPTDMKTCKARGCMDGVLNGFESDIDCGDSATTSGQSAQNPMPCAPCKATNDVDAPKCWAGGHCDTKICQLGGCRVTNPVYMTVEGATAGQTLGLTLLVDNMPNVKRTVTLDGKSSTKIMLGEAYWFRVIVSTQPTGLFCSFVGTGSGSPNVIDGRTGYDYDTKKPGTERTVALSCSGSESALDIDTTGLTAGVVQLNSTIAGKDKLVSISKDGRTTLDGSGTYKLAIASQPGQMTIEGSKKYVHCELTKPEGTIAKGSHVAVKLTCTQYDCPAYVACGGDLYQTITGLPSGGQVGVKVTWANVAATTSYSANATTRLQSGKGNYTLEIPTQPGDVGAQGSQSYVKCSWSNDTNTVSGTVDQADVTQVLTCTSAQCPDPQCTGALSIAVTGLPAGGTVKTQVTLGGQTTAQTFTTNSTMLAGEKKGAYTLGITQQPGFVTIGDKQNFVSCAWSNLTANLSGTLDSSDVTQTLTCTATQCPAPACVTSCTTDADCTSNDCECGASSGNCAANSGKCGEGRAKFSTPTTDGVSASGMFTVPAGCNQVYVEAWGAAGGSGKAAGIFGPPMTGFGGGAGGYVSGYLTVSPGDVLTAWVGQGGGTPGDTEPGGTPSIGSNVGTLASGGAGDGNDEFDVNGAGGGGGGLTSFTLTGGATATILVPAGGGGTTMEAGHDVSSTPGFDTVLMSGGEAGASSTGSGGGGAGELGGAGGQGNQSAGFSGTYSMLPMSLSASDGSLGQPANTSAPDYTNLCVGTSAGAVKAGAAGGMMYGYGGDGCVIFRCKAL